MAIRELATPCEHGHYKPHGGCGPLYQCMDTTYYANPGETPEHAFLHKEPQRGYWHSFGMEYERPTWAVCDHDPECPGGRRVSLEEAIKRMVPGLSEMVYAMALGLHPDDRLVKAQGEFILRSIFREVDSE